MTNLLQFANLELFDGEYAYDFDTRTAIVGDSTTIEGYRILDSIPTTSTTILFHSALT